MWSEDDGIMLYPHRRARKVGDLIIVRIVEDPEAELNANTKTSRSSTIEAKLKFLGYMGALAEANSRLAQIPGEDDLINASLGSSFDGKGTSDREGHVKAYVSAIVVKVFPNGNLFINGKREIKVNNETQYITISGMVRPEDISATNEISSTYVANARITYSGIGPLADKQKPGWLGRVVDHVWPF
ncbi:MAG: flagellar basal body L-ring protein FlgH [Deltaproteobacteria bacterium]|nr:flagellar basal body L-ring protein FlgH [Deltaproteobacteria bacterium]